MLQNISPLALGGIITIAIFALLVPLSLRMAGLTGQQIQDTIALTLQFFINLVREFRSQNANPRE